MAQYQDPWSWVDQQKPSAPLAAQIQSSTPEQIAPMYLQPQRDPMEQQLQSMAMGKGIDAAGKGLEAGYKAYNASAAPLTTNAVNTLGTGMKLGGAAPAAASAAAPVSQVTLAPLALPNAVTMGTPIVAEAGGMYALTPTLGAAGGTGAALGSAGTAVGSGLATAAPAAATAAGAGTGAALGTGAAVAGETALAALGPVGWAIGAGLLAKKLGIF